MAARAARCGAVAVLGRAAREAGPRLPGSRRGRRRLPDVRVVEAGRVRQHAARRMRPVWEQRLSTPITSTGGALSNARNIPATACTLQGLLALYPFTLYSVHYKAHNLTAARPGLRLITTVQLGPGGRLAGVGRPPLCRAWPLLWECRGAGRRGGQMAKHLLHLPICPVHC